MSDGFAPSRHYYRLPVMAGGATVAVCLLLALADSLSFTWQSDSGITGWIAVHRYPKQQEVIFFAATMLGIPAIMAAGWVTFRLVATGLARSLRQPPARVHAMLAALHLPALSAGPAVWALDPQAWEIIPAALAIGTVPILLLVGLTEWGLRLCRSRRTRDADRCPASGTLPAPHRPVRSAVPGRYGRRFHHAWIAVRMVVYGGLVPILLYGLAFNPSIDRGICLFHDAEFLIPAQEIGNGAIPYRDIYLQHGLLHNAWFPLLGMHLFGPTLAGVRTLHQYIEPLGLLAVYALVLATFRLPLVTAPLAALVFLAAGMGGRGVFGFFSLAMLASALRPPHRLGDGSTRARPIRRGGWRLMTAGLLAMLAFWHSVEVGIYSLAAGGAFTALAGVGQPLGVPWRIRPLPLVYYLAGALIGFWSIGWYFLWHGAFVDVMRNVWIQCAYQIDIWGLATPSFLQAIRPVLEAGDREAVLAALQTPAMQFHLGALTLASATAVLIYRAAGKAFWTSPWAPQLLLLYLAGICFYRTVLGRSDIWHTDFSVFFSTLLALFAVAALSGHAFDYLRDRSRRMPIRLGGGVPRLALAVLLGVYVYGYIRDRWDPQQRVVDRWEALTWPRPLTTAATEPLPGAGIINLGGKPAAIQPVIDYIRAHTAPDERVYDFSNQPLYLFFADRRPASAAFLAAYASLPAMQETIIADLDRHGVRLVIERGGGWSDRIDGVDQRQRLPMIADYLDTHFQPPVAVGRVQLRHRND